jgi:hypothetical protein
MTARRKAAGGRSSTKAAKVAKATKAAKVGKTGKATQAFGPFYRDIYYAHKLREWELCFYPVSDEQRRKYLTFI